MNATEKRIKLLDQVKAIVIVLISLVFTVRSNNCVAQINQMNDSLPHHYRNIADAIYKISLSYELDGHWDDAISLLERGIEIMRQGKNNKGKAQLQALLGGIIWKIGYHEKALDMLHEAHKISESLNDKKTWGNALYNIGEIYYIKQFLMLEEVGNMALEFHESALKIREETGDQAGVTHSLSRIGVIHERQGDDNRALEYYGQAIKLAEETSYQRGLTRPFTHIGAYHRRNGNIKKALEYFQKALTINEELGNKEGILFAHDNLGQAIYYLKGDFDEALGHYLQALTIANKLDFKLAIARTLFLIGTLYKDNGDEDKALEYFEKTVESVQDIGYRAFIEAALKETSRF